MAQKNILIKSKTRPWLYRSLSFINPQLFPISHSKPINSSDLYKTIKIIESTGMNINEIENNLYNASKGEKNELYKYLDGSSISDDNPERVYLILILFGILITIILFKIFSMLS